tara:strand:+ start:3991 stop:5370 length:1380 start_codon:yes stop_codon:yes gene_type:complete
MSRKIAIVGATPEAFIQLGLLVNNRRYDAREKYGDDEFTLIHDPDKVYPYMLSGIGVAFQEILEREIFFTKRVLEKYCDGVDSCGYKYVGWGNRRDKNFMVSGCSNTFNIEKLRKLFLDDGGKIFGDKVSIVQQTIDSFQVTDDGCTINGNEYDYVIDCTEKNPLGWEDDYMNPSVVFSNTALIFENPEPSHWNYTIEYAAQYGHIVGIPLQDKQRWVYLYDSSICTKEQVIEDFKGVFPETFINLSLNNNWDENSFIPHNWKPKISNYVIHPKNKRYIRNGSALINIEPGAPGTSAESSAFIAEQICRYLFNDNARDREVHDHMLQLQFSSFIIQTLQSFLCFTYQYGSRHDTPYWNRIKKEATEYLNSPVFSHPGVFAGHKFLDNIISETFTEEDFRIAHHSQNASGALILPYSWMNNANMFYEYSLGLGSPYSHLLSTLGNVDPPEPFGEIGYDCI